MAPFNSPAVVLSGFKEKAESLFVHGNRLYVGTATGNLYIYDLHGLQDEATLTENKKGLCRRSIDQLEYIKDINSLLLVAPIIETIPTIYPLPAFAPPTQLVRAKGAYSFALHSSVQNAQLDSGGLDKTGVIPMMVTQLIIGCRRKVVLYAWRDGEPEEPKETILPHSPRAMVFLDDDNVCFAYSPTDYAVFSISKSTTVDVMTPIPAATSMGTFSGLTGYMTLGLGAKAKPGLVRMSDTEVLVVKDNQGFVIGQDGRQSKPGTITWPGSPDEISYVTPYVLSILPPGTVPLLEERMNSPPSVIQPSTIPTPVIQVTSSINNLPVQVLPLPFQHAPSSAPPNSNCTLRLLTPSPSAKSPLYLISTPVDRTLAASEGSCLWQVKMKPWAEQIDELVQKGVYEDALTLLETLDPALLPDKGERRTLIRLLNAVSQFRVGNYDDAIDTFIELNLNPAKVVALYPEHISGRLSVPQDGWIQLFGGPTNPSPKQEDAMSINSSDTSKEASKEKMIERSPSPTGSVRARTKTSFGALLPSASKDDDVAFSSGRKKGRPIDGFSRSVETLWRYLTDRRPQVAGALAAVQITSAQSHQWPFLSETSTNELFALPNVSLSLLTPEQLIRFAQIVDTALFKSYLLYRPALLGPLCRVANWCEMSEVEEELRARERFDEMIFLYNGKKMHGKALNLLQQLSEKKDDMKDKLIPTISYLQKLGPEHLQHIFESARWVFDQDRDMAFEIFTSDAVELPRAPVADYLEKIDTQICARYIEYLIEEKEEDSVIFHDRLAELYLNITMAAKKRGDEKKRTDLYSKLLQFIDTTHHYRPDRLYGLLSEDLYEARAILLGRMGRHEHALELYVYKLGDFTKAEEHCKRVCQPGTTTSGIFLTLLKLYLRPTVKNAPDLLQPALDLIVRHGLRLDQVETLQLLPPLVTARDVRPFLQQALRTPMFDSHVFREIYKARAEHVARTLMVLESRRVKVTDSRICPQCHKRLGSSVIAVHAPRGEVTHYQCREAFSRKLNAIRLA
ncbi:hypothetical protein F5I97DRAFT_2037539 [Phlebopus sp. FC_14]|nr:hypothetical protein F5I97DRAFT_2037539 [Phlebopus sp. FC_14]